MKNNSTTQISTLVEFFVSDLREIIHLTAIENIRDALQGSLTLPKRRGSNRRNKAGTRTGQPRRAHRAAGKGKASKRAARRTPNEIAVIGDAVLKHVRTNPGQRLEDIGLALKEPTKNLKRPIANLIATKQMITEGVKRGTRYFVKARTKAKS